MPLAGECDQGRGVSKFNWHQVYFFSYAQTRLQVESWTKILKNEKPDSVRGFWGPQLEIAWCLLQKSISLDPDTIEN